jgi:thioredoxin 1
MNTPEELIERFAEAEKPVRISPGKAGKFSILAAVVGIIINLAGDALFQERTSGATMAGLVSGVAIAVGIVAAMWGLARAWRCPGKDAMILAGTGLAMNGILLLIGFITLPIPANINFGPKSISAKEINVNPISSKGGPKIVTKDWTASVVIELNGTDFDDIVNKSNVPVLVDFYAPWCGACRMMSPTIEDLAKEYEGKVKVCKLNVDKAPEISARFNIRYIPRIILFKYGRVKNDWGAVSQAEISGAIDKLL